MGKPWDSFPTKWRFSCENHLYINLYFPLPCLIASGGNVFMLRRRDHLFANVVNPKMHSTKGRKKHMENEVWPTVEVLPLGMIVLFTDPFWEVDPSGM